MKATKSNLEKLANHWQYLTESEKEQVMDALSTSEKLEFMSLCSRKCREEGFNILPDTTAYITPSEQYADELDRNGRIEGEPNTY